MEKLVDIHHALNRLAATKDAPDTESESFQAVKPHGITRGARYYGGKKS